MKDKKRAFPRPLDGHEGMELRDYFAAKAMQAAISNQDMVTSINKISNHYEVSNVSGLVDFSYQIADAMLKQREL